MVQPRIGVIGVGNMGLGVARRLRELGLPVGVRDIDPARASLAAAGGCTVAASPAVLAAGSDLLVVVVVDAAQVRDVLFGPAGAAPALAAGSGVLLCPTISPADVESLAAQLANTGIDALDAPMSGGPVRAREGRMSLMVAGPDTVFTRWLPVLQRMADPVFRVGIRAGDGARTKLVNNLLAAVNLMGASEALALASRLGLDPSRTLDVIEQSSGQSWIGSHRLRRALAGDDAAQAHMTLLAKDSALAMAEARSSHASAPVGAAAAEGFSRALRDGLGSADDSALYRWLLEMPGP
jgi:L-threonate 2-dehydrogenase